jgi:hypothetical protein
VSEESLEVPEADALEQEADVIEGAEEPKVEPEDPPLEADPADVAEQAREVDLDDDEDYR